LTISRGISVFAASHNADTDLGLKASPEIETTLTSMYQGAYEGTRQIQMAQWPMQGLA
jgi:hypothetical protein